MKTFFTSDHHFAHKNIINLCNRPFQSQDEMRVAMIERWNSVVSTGDTVYHLGDFSLGGIESFRNIVYLLNGFIKIVPGNHDKKWIKSWVNESAKIEVLNNIHTFSDDGVDIVLCHYPMEEWEGYYRGAYHLHGHCHGNMKTKLPKRMDVGVDCHNFYPLELSDIIKMMENEIDK